MAEFRMPSLGADMETGTVYDWRVKPGDKVGRGDIIVTVETDKGAIDVEIFEEGVISEILVPEGTEVPVGTILALLNGGARPPAPQPQPTAVTPKREEPAHPMDQRPLVTSQPVTPVTNGRRLRISPAARRRAEELGLDLHTLKRTGPAGAISLADVERAASQAAPAKPDERIKATPVARRMAAELGVDLSQVQGTGPAGAINRADVAKAAQPAAAAQPAPIAPTPPPATPPPPPREKVDFQTGMRRAIALAMSRSNRDIPHYYLEDRVDMSKALTWLQNENRERSVKERLLPAVLFIKATALALSEVPSLNGYWLEDGFQPQEAIHIGFAIALRQGGLVTPAFHHADLASLDELMVTLRDLITRTRSGRLRSSELTDPTITLTSLGDRGAEKVYGVIYPPQVALVGLGKVAEQPWAENGMLGIRPVMHITLAGDHRASDGHTGALFLEAFNSYLQDPEKLK
ncbi:MAG: 2-oxo acid dehydrogenase subunit E2 [Anaerolineales bacterium]|nr:2-oxo acid dehydrogenase subunit E2 [Anaerolineales bacterium]